MEVIAHVGARRSGIVVLDVDDWDHEERTLTFHNQPDRGARLKEGDDHERKVILSEAPAKVIAKYVDRTI